ncbi:hypothetical protein [uncultured Ruminococcus sp.]|uniref:hypothetical protein n=1 Tax=Ruminococcus sp. TaxID=41978 RepID=UPI002665ACED|nr:hypothetical protein [uncultured Ruminococcus sp.]
MKKEAAGMQLYQDMLYLPHPVSQKHAAMPRRDRAAQFSPFAALTGYDAAIAESRRRTYAPIELTEDRAMLLNQCLHEIMEHLPEKPSVTVIYFLPDLKKSGGAYMTAYGIVRKVDVYHRVLTLDGYREIPLDSIWSIQIEKESVFPR